MIAFDAWSDVARWVWDGHGGEDAPIRSCIGTLIALAGHVLGGDPPLVAAVTPGGAHRARGLLRDIETTRRWFHDIGVLPDEGGGSEPSSPEGS